MAELISKFDDHHEYIWKCECADWHYLQIGWDDKDVQWRWLEVTDTWHPTGWWERIRVAAKLLRGKPHFHGGIMLDEANVNDLLAVLSKHAADSNAKTVDG